MPWYTVVPPDTDAFGHRLGVDVLDVVEVGLPAAEDDADEPALELLVPAALALPLLGFVTPAPLDAEGPPLFPLGFAPAAPLTTEKICPDTISISARQVLDITCILAKEASRHASRARRRAFIADPEVKLASKMHQSNWMNLQHF